MKYLFSLFFFLVTTPLLSQPAKMKVEGKPYLSETEIVARRTPDGRFCAGIQILSDLDGFSYDSYLGVVGGIEDKPGQDIIYLDPAERAVLLYHVGYEPLKIILSEIGVQLKEKQMWVLKIKGGVVDLLPVSFVIEPENTQLFIDGKNSGPGPTFELKAGKHTIRIVKNDYQTIEDTITVNANNVLFKYQLIFKPEMIFIEGGTFEMGDTFSEGNDDEKPVHTVTINSFYMSQYEVTFAEYDAFCEATGRDRPVDYRWGRGRPDDFGWGRGLRPFSYVSWYDAVEYCNWLSQKEGLTLCYKIDKSQEDPNNTSDDYEDLKWRVTCDFAANGYRLPTEAEWEYAAREGGRKVRFGNGKNIADPKEINFDGSADYKKAYSVAGVYRGKTVTVGRFSPNSLGLYDMSGNVREWCWDWYDSAYYQKSPRNNPTGPSSGGGRILRGGSSLSGPNDVRAANRGSYMPFDRYGIGGGFRLVKTF